MFTDADWAGCKETRKSSSAGVAMSGSHALKAYTRKQKIIHCKEQRGGRTIRSSTGSF